MCIVHHQYGWNGVKVSKYVVEEVRELYRLVKGRKSGVGHAGLDAGVSDVRESLVNVLEMLGIERKDSIDAMYREFERKYLTTQGSEV